MNTMREKIAVLEAMEKGMTIQLVACYPLSQREQIHSSSNYDEARRG